jgi:Protein of unknown function (DUF3892)
MERRKPMSDRMEIQCVQKSDCSNPDERILSIGGVDPDGKAWKMSEGVAIDGIKNGRYRFYVNRGGYSVEVIIAKSQHGHEFLKTTSDGEAPNNLLSLPECS